MENMTAKDKVDWIDLCNYIKYEILEYTVQMKFPKYLALRLKGLASGNFIANKKISSNANYTYEEILITCKLCSHKIKKYFQDNSAKIADEKHKINIILVFVENEINDVVLRLQQKNKVEQDVKKISFENYNVSQVEYKSKITEVKERDRFNELW